MSDQNPAPADGQQPADPPPAGSYAPPAGHYAPPAAQYAPPAGQYAAPPSYPGAPLPPYAQPGIAYPGGPSSPGGPDTRPKVLAIIALVASIVGLLIAFIPFLGWLSAPILLAALVMAIIALALKSQGGKGLSITALIISVVGGIMAIVVTVVAALFATISTFETIDDGVTDPFSPGGGEPVTSAEPVQILETAFGQDTLDPELWWYVVIVDNPNPDAVFEFGEITTEAVDASGTILDSSTDYITMLPGQVAVSGSFYEVGANQITSLEVIGPDPAVAVTEPSTGAGEFAVGELTAGGDDYVTEVSGTVTGQFPVDQEFVGVTVVARDPGGTIIGGTSTYIERLPADGGSARFEAIFFSPLPADSVYEAYPFL
ncbi:DUF4190 domain-containing protein [Microbacterium sp. ET2]|uniref:DUF4190 domain-containing protein n=1 Tax=Microbacterium albipurpureum TaxID=3050384 RepID=UPI00259CE09B|nr:DUF4190 domain-containing protein [Microbacterium sp. ET2 (Ac-2212)]WJL96279.1 DUF4190 domain-containing protein [Microbacterium sp. ET2 (Ac-2212)]